MDGQIQFQASLYGYRKNQVHDYLAELKRDYEGKKEDLAAKHREALSESKTLGAQLQELASDLQRYREQEHLIARVLIEAQIRANAIEHEAHERAERLNKQIMDEVASKRSELGSLKARVEQFKTNFCKTLDSYKASLLASDDLSAQDGVARSRAGSASEVHFSPGL